MKQRLGIASTISMKIPRRACVWSARDLSPLWFGAERRWTMSETVHADCDSTDVTRGSAANQSGDESYALHNATAIGHAAPNRHVSS
jgi:hypothetical protein